MVGENQESARASCPSPLSVPLCHTPDPSPFALPDTARQCPQQDAPSAPTLCLSWATSACVGFWPRARRRSPSWSALMRPVPRLSKREKASLVESWAEMGAGCQLAVRRRAKRGGGRRTGLHEGRGGEERRWVQGISDEPRA